MGRGTSKANKTKDKTKSKFKGEFQKALPPGREPLALPPGREQLALPPGRNETASTTEQKPTNARDIENMNEAQLQGLVRRYERRVESLEKQIDAVNNSASMRDMEFIAEHFQGGVGYGGPRFQRTVDRYSNAVDKWSELNENLKDARRSLETYQKAYDRIKGTGLTGAELRIKNGSSGGTLSGKWSKGTVTATGPGGAYFSIFHRPGDSIKAYKNGSFDIYKPHAAGFVLVNNGKQLGEFNTLKEAKAAAEKYSKK